MTSPTAPLNILLVAEESAGMQTLRFLADGPHRLVGVVASPDKTGPSQTVWQAAERLGVRRWPARQVKQAGFADVVREHDVDLLLNVHSLFLIHGAVLEACRIGAFNLHPGPLPEYAGLNVPSWAIYHGESEHAVTLHQMVPQIDAGTIAYVSRFPIEPNDTGLTLTLKCVRAGLPLVKQLVETAADDPSQIPRIEQDVSKRRYFDGGIPDGGRLPWNRPASDVVNHVRASDYSPFPSPWGTPQTQRAGRPLGILKAAVTGRPTNAAPGTIGESTERGLLVAAEDDWVLVEKVIDGDLSVAASSVLTTGGRLV